MIFEETPRDVELMARLLKALQDEGVKFTINRTCNTYTVEICNPE